MSGYTLCVCVCVYIYILNKKKKKKKKKGGRWVIKIRIKPTPFPQTAEDTEQWSQTTNIMHTNCSLKSNMNLSVNERTHSNKN